MIEIKPTEDHNLLASLNEEVQRLHHAMHPHVFKPFDEAGIADMFQSFLADEDCIAYIASRNGEAVGYIILFVKQTGDNAFHYNRRFVYIDQLGVKEKYRRSGVAESLLAEAEKYAKMLSVNHLELDHWTNNELAGAYFKKQGYLPLKSRLSKTI